MQGEFLPILWMFFSDLAVMDCMVNVLVVLVLEVVLLLLVVVVFGTVVVLVVVAGVTLHIILTLPL